MIPVISVVGKSGTGKTTLLEKLIPEVKKRGYRVAVIKHDAHRFEIDKPGKDSYRHYHAGADAVLISSAEKMAMISRTDGEEIHLDELVNKLPPVDIILTEGYRAQNKPKIEVHRKEVGSHLLCSKEEVICYATDEPLDVDQICFEINDAVGIVDLILERFIRNQPI